jgi:hypothetical protein
MKMKMKLKDPARKVEYSQILDDAVLLLVKQKEILLK